MQQAFQPSAWFSVQLLLKPQDLEWDADDLEVDYPHLNKFIKAIQEFRIYIEQNQSFIPNYGERWRNGERISTSFVESTVNVVINKRFNKKQQMQWTERGAHLLLQARTRVLNDELTSKFEQWYPGFKKQQQKASDIKLAA